MIPIDNISPKKELLLEQIENFERSGYFTEKEMNRMCAPLRMELEFLEVCESHNKTVENLSDATSSFDEFIIACKRMGETGYNINVTDAEILTLNKPQA